MPKASAEAAPKLLAWAVAPKLRLVAIARPRAGSNGLIDILSGLKGAEIPKNF
jgi:hypothetical protein